MAFLNSSNPTKLRVGATGRLDGRNYEVVGRVVLSTADGYKWQEYNLRTPTGENVTLVYESGDWKLFRLFEPAIPMPLEQAEQVRTDETVTVDGWMVKVTYVGKSRVVYIEGVAPEGVELGDRADYFNAERSSGNMLVVSWTGTEMEYYRGENLRTRDVVNGFNLPRPNVFVRANEAFRAMNVDAGGVVVVGFFLVFFLVQLWDHIPERDPVFPEPAPKQAAPAAHLAENAVGRIDGHTYTVIAHALVEVARPGLRFDRYEYSLVNESGEPALLLQGWDSVNGDWALLLPASFSSDVTPLTLARLQTGLAKGANNQDVKITFLLQSRARVIEGQPEGRRWPAEVQYGLVGQVDRRWMLVRWTERQVWCDIGWRHSAKEMAEAFQMPGLVAK